MKYPKTYSQRKREEVRKKIKEMYKDTGGLWEDEEDEEKNKDKKSH